jgi:signal transduction histidine kinase
MRLFSFYIYRKNKIRHLSIFVLCAFLLGCNKRKDFHSSPTEELQIADSLQQVIYDNPTKRDSLHNYILDIDTDSIKVKTLFEISYHYYSKRDSINFRYWNQKTFDVARLARDTLRIAEANWDLANFYYQRHKLDSSYYHYNIAFNLYERIGEELQAGRMLLNIATIQKDIKDFLSSEVTTIEAIRKIRPFQRTYQMYLAYNNLGVTNGYLEEYENAIRYHGKALDYAEEMNDEILTASSLNNLGIVYKNKGNYNQAVEMYSKALEMDSLELRDSQLQAMLIDNLAFSRFKLGDTSFIEREFSRALKFREEINHLSGIAVSHLHLGEYFLHKLDTLEAYSHFQKSKEISFKNGLNRELLQSTLALARLYGPNSSHFFDQYVQLKDSLDKQDRTLQNRFARIRYETDELIAETERLNEQRVWIILLSLLLMLTLLLLYFLKIQRSRNKELLFSEEQQKANEEIYKLMLKQQAKLEEGRDQERRRISADLHDAVLGRLYGTRLSLEFLNIKLPASENNRFHFLTGELQDIEKEIREISHDLLSRKIFANSGFLNLIENLVTEKNALGIMNFKLQYDEGIEWERIEEGLQIDIYRIVQETLQNCIKHSRAQEVIVDIAKSGENLLVEVADDGKGFQTSGKEGIGLQNIQTRVDYWGGDLTIFSEPDKGTKIFCSFRLKKLKDE